MSRNREDTGATSGVHRCHHYPAITMSKAMCYVLSHQEYASKCSSVVRYVYFTSPLMPSSTWYIGVRLLPTTHSKIENIHSSIYMHVMVIIPYCSH